MQKPHHWTPAEQAFLHKGGVESFTPEWRARRNKLIGLRNEGEDSFSDERYQFSRMQYQGYTLGEE